MPACTFDVAQLAVGGDAAGAVARPLGDGDRLVQHGRALLVAPPARVDERGAERDERPRPQLLVAARRRLGAGPPQALDRRSRPRPPRRPPRPPRAARARRRARPTAAARAAGRTRRRRGAPRATGRTPSSRRSIASHALGLGAARRSGRPPSASAPHQQLVVALLERVERDHARWRGRTASSCGRRPGRRGPPRAAAPRDADACRRRSTSSHASKPGLDANDSPSSSSPPRVAAAARSQRVHHGVRAAAPAAAGRRGAPPAGRAPGAAPPGSTAARRAGRPPRGRAGPPARAGRRAGRSAAGAPAAPTPCRRAAGPRARRRARSRAVRGA